MKSATTNTPITIIIANNGEYRVTKTINWVEKKTYSIFSTALNTNTEYQNKNAVQKYVTLFFSIDARYSLSDNKTNFTLSQSVSFHVSQIYNL